MERDELVRVVDSVARIEGSFTLRSGRVATEYFDKYQFESDPDVLAAIAGHLAELVPPGTQVLAGLELGGVPVATALSACTGLPAVFVRKRAKAYGTARLAEGPDVAGRRVTIVEDVVTSGGQVVESARELRGLGAEVAHALVVVDRQEGGAEALAEAGIVMSALITRAELDAARL